MFTRFRYHYYRDGKYPIPNDDVEQNREDMKHAMFMELTDGKLFHAPIGETPGKILDLGTGVGEPDPIKLVLRTRTFIYRFTGTWAIEGASDSSLRATLSHKVP